MSAVLTADQLSQYQALTTQAGFARLTGRTQLKLTGEDRATFLHNFCTNEIRRLPVGQGCEAFVTDGKGAIIAYVYIFCDIDSLVVETATGLADKLFQHLDRYIIREKVEITDQSTAWNELLLAGPHAEAILNSLAPGLILNNQAYSHQTVSLGSFSVDVRRTEYLAGDCYFLSHLSEQSALLQAALRSAGVIECDAEVIEAARIEQGTPVSGQDILAKTLPQELVRDDKAISFTKGCYLGQETVARIDALGHVNKTLCGVRFFSPEPPAVGTQLRAVKPSGDETAAAEIVVGELTSTCYSPKLQSGLGLAYIRRSHNAVGTKLTSEAGEAQIIALPVE